MKAQSASVIELSNAKTQEIDEDRFHHQVAYHRSHKSPWLPSQSPSSVHADSLASRCLSRQSTHASAFALRMPTQTVTYRGRKSLQAERSIERHTKLRILSVLNSVPP